MPAREEMPATIERSPKKAQETWSKAHDSAVEEYGEGERAHRTAFAALKHSFEKVGDHWEAKKAKGPSDKQAARSGAKARKARQDRRGRRRERVQAAPHGDRLELDIRAVRGCRRTSSSTPSRRPTPRRPATAGPERRGAQAHCPAVGRLTADRTTGSSASAIAR